MRAYLPLQFVGQEMTFNAAYSGYALTVNQD